MKTNEIDIFKRLRQDSAITGIILFTISVFGLYLLFTITDSPSISNPELVFWSLLFGFIENSLFTILLLITYILSKKRSRKAIIFGYIVGIYGIIIWILSHINDTSSLFDFLAILILYDTIHLHKQLKTQLTVPTPPIQQM